MSKARMRCPRCSKTFKSSDAKQTLCPDCLAKEKAARARGATQPAGAKPAPKVVSPAPIIMQTPPPPDLGMFGSAARRAELGEHRQERHPAPAGHHVGQSATRHEAATATHAQGSHGTHEGTASQGSATATKAQHPPKTPKKPKERIPEPPQDLTAEQRAQVEKRYRELAQPTEFDGIRTQIASELDLPKTLVRKAILDLRKREGLPSWWEVQAFPGTQGDLERVRAAYAPLLPVPPVGVHKQIAQQLGLEAHAVYKGIRQIRTQMGLPQFNPPEQHPEYVAANTAAQSSGAQAPAP